MMMNLRLSAMVDNKNIFLKILKDSDVTVPILNPDSINDFGFNLFEKDCKANAKEEFDSIIHDIISKYKSKNNCSIIDIIDMITDIEKMTDINIANNLFI